MSKQRFCCVPCCKDEKFSLVHKFPADNERAEQWCQMLSIDSFIGLPIDVIRKRFYVCSRHFRDSDYKHKASRSINITAVPSINLVTLNDPEGLNREIPPLVRPTPVEPVVVQGHEPNEEQQDPVEQELPFPGHNLANQDEEMEEEMAQPSDASFELNDILDGDPFVKMNSLKKITPTVPHEISITVERPAKRSFPERFNLPVPGGQRKVKILTQKEGTQAPIPGVAMARMVNLNTLPGVRRAVEKKRLVLKRVSGPSLMLERKKCSVASTMTQTDDSPAAPDNADEVPDEGMVDGTGGTSSTKVLALLECTSENLQRLQRKLHEHGGALPLDDHLLQLDDEAGDKAMSPIKADGSVDRSNFLTVRNVKTDETVSVSYVWLRDHCRCESCYDADTFQRSTSILDLPLDIAPKSCDIKDERIEIVWQDEHVSSYDLQQVFDNQVDSFRKRLNERRSQLVLWDKELIVSNSTAPGYASVTLNELLCEDAVMRQVVHSLVTYGFAFITKVPPNQQSTEIAVKRIFPVQRTLFGDMWTFSESKMDHSDTAYTNKFLGPHTDNTYFNDAAGLQVLHCIQFNGKGAETILVDGFLAVERLREADPDAFERLCEYPLEAEYIEEDKHHQYTAPVLKRHRILPSPAIEQVRFNPYDRAAFRTIASSDVPQFYADYRKLASAVYQEELQWKFQLTPGTVLIFDNWRVLHGRMAYSGKRVMTGCYVARTEYQSVARMMGLIE